MPAAIATAIPMTQAMTVLVEPEVAPAPDAPLAPVLKLGLPPVRVWLDIATAAAAAALNTAVGIGGGETTTDADAQVALLAACAAVSPATPPNSRRPRVEGRTSSSVISGSLSLESGSRSVICSTAWL